MEFMICDICGKTMTGAGDRYPGPRVKFGNDNANPTGYVIADICMGCHRRIRDKIKENRKLFNGHANTTETDGFEDFWKGTNNAEA